MPRQGLDATRVVDAAAAIADTDGLEQVTLARVAAALRVRPPSLYNHVRGHEDLRRLLKLRGLTELADVLRDAAVGRAGAEALRAIADAYRAYAHAHPGTYRAFQRVPAVADEEVAAAAQRVLDVLLAVLSAWRLGDELAVQRIRVIRSALHGFVDLELSGGFGLPPALDAAFHLLVDTLLAGLGAPA